jgi:dihydrodipicolinate synthase/N-acetylneuraminate lyase
VDAVLLNGPVWGEGMALSRQERLTLVEAALDTVRGRCPVLISITGHTAKETSLTVSELDHLVYRYSYPGPIFWVDAPICYHSNRNLPQFYKALTLETPFEFILYNHPVLVRGFKKSIYHKNIRTSVLKKLSENNRIIGLIFTGAMNRCLDYQRAVRYHQRFRIYDGDEKQFLARPSSSGVLAGGSNFLPITWREITHSSLNIYDTRRNDSDHIYQILEAGNMLQNFYNLYCKEPARVMKYILHAIGIIAEARTVDAKDELSKSQVDHINQLLKEYM